MIVWVEVFEVDVGKLYFGMLVYFIILGDIRMCYYLMVC